MADTEQDTGVNPATDLQKDGSFGMDTRVGVSRSGVIYGNAVAPDLLVNVKSENLRADDMVLTPQGLRGQIDAPDGSSRNGVRLVQGKVSLDGSTSNILAMVNGIVASGSDMIAKPSFDHVAYDLWVRRGEVLHLHQHCLVSRFVMKCAAATVADQGFAIESQAEKPRDGVSLGRESIVDAEFTFVGAQEKPESQITSSNNEQFSQLEDATVTVAVKNAWLLGDCELSVAEKDYPLIGFGLSVAYDIQPVIRGNMRAECFRCLGREIVFSVKVPYTPENAEALFSPEHLNIPVELSVNAKDAKTIFRMPTCRRVEKVAPTRGEPEVPLSITFRAYQRGTGEILTILSS